MNKNIFDTAVKKAISLCEESGNKLLYLSKFGSMLYGTNSENSDIDLKGVFLPNKDYLLLGKRIDHLTFCSSNSSTKNTHEDFDIQLYSIQKFLDFVKQGDSGALDLFFSYTNPNAILYKDKKFFDFIIKNKNNLCDKFNTRAFIGYAIGQATKYGVKGSKLKALLTLKKYLDKANLDDILGLHLEEILNYLIQELGENNSFYSIEVSHGKDAEYSKRNLRLLGKVHQDNITLKEFSNRIETEIKRYGDRSKLALDCNGLDFKALSHCVRVIFQAKTLIENGEIYFPLENADLIKKIKLGQLSYSEIEQLIEDGIYSVDQLRQNNDNKFKYIQSDVNNFILSYYN